MTYVSPKSKWYQVFGDFLYRKKKLGLDKWGNDIDPAFDKLYTDLEQHMLKNIPERHHRALYPGPWSLKWYLTRVSRDMLFSQYAQHEFAELFVGLSYEELDELAASFKLENCVQRDQLNQILKDY